MLPGLFPDKATPVIDFPDETVIQCDVPVIKILFLGDVNIQMITNRFWC